MAENRLRNAVNSGRTALGVWANDPETVELCAFMGFDWIMIDMMFTGMDFRDVQTMIRTCQGAGITPVVRMQMNPWHGYDAHMAVDLSRIQGIGAEYVLRAGRLRWNSVSPSISGASAGGHCSVPLSGRHAGRA